MALTLAEFSVAVEDKSVGAFIQDVLYGDGQPNAQFFMDIPFETTNAISKQVKKWAALPTPGFRLINEPFSVSTGKIEEQSEAVVDLGSMVDVDIMYMKDTRSTPDPMAWNMEMHGVSIKVTFLDKFVNGDIITDVKSFNGIKRRLEAISTRQNISVGTNGLQINASQANRQEFIRYMNRAISLLPGAEWAIMNRDTYQAVRHVLIIEGKLDTTKDAFDRDIPVWGGVKLFDIGPTLTGLFDDTVSGGLIIPNDEVEGTSSDCTSIYFGKWGPTQLQGIQEHPMEITPEKILEDGVTVRKVIRWPVGLEMAGRFPLVRLRGLRVPTS